MAVQSEQNAHADLVGGGQTTLHTHSPPKLNECSVPDGSVDFSQEQAVSLVIENRTSDPGSPVDGQVWLRTDL